MSFEIDPNKVYYMCRVCGYVFQEDPYKMPIRCAQCNSEEVERT